jgi:glycerol-3-phosphate dehydrogenase (NAD(P)+)
MAQFLKNRSNGLLTLPQSVKLSTSIACVEDADVVIISVNSQGLRALLEKELLPLNLQNKIFVLCMKGIEIESGKRLSEIVEETLHPSNRTAVWLGPGHVQEFYAGIPNCMVIDSRHEEVKKLLVDSFSGALIRFYYGQDLIGNEVGAAAKNVIGIAAGFLDGMRLSTLKGALMSRGTHEIANLIEAMGGNPFSAYGLCHLGDYEATVFSPFSHNRRFGEAFIKKIGLFEIMVIKCAVIENAFVILFFCGICFYDFDHVCHILCFAMIAHNNPPFRLFKKLLF